MFLMIVLSGDNEYEKGKYVILRDEDFDNIPVASTKTIDIVDFVETQFTTAKVIIFLTVKEEKKHIFFWVRQ
ncbi:Ku protein [Anoxybacter fermentans]|uniref:Ku protein n=1 Tax=Anoxybacter fermentans TaxID=1323375 RepID=UPI00196B9020|nr:Ku protein [Anoxybacter fermentans]